VRKLALWASALVALYAVVGFLIAPPIARQQLERALSEQLGRKVTIERVRINPFALSAAARDFSLKERDGTTDAITFDELRVNVTLSSLFRLGVVVEAAQLLKPHVRLVRGEDEKYNFQDIIDKFANAPAAPPGPSPRFAIYNVEVRDGRIDFDDQPQKTRHAVTDLQIGLPFVSSLPRQVDIVVVPRLSANVNGTPFEIVGEAKPFKETHEATLRIDIEDLELGRYLSYSPIPLRIRIPSGRLNTRLVLSYAAGSGERLQKLALSGTASLKRLTIEHADGAPLAALGELGVDLDSWDFLQRHAAIKTVRVAAPEVDITRMADGSFKLLGIFPPAPANPPSAASSSEPSLTFSVGGLSLTDGKLRFVDQTPAKPIRLALNNLSLKVTDLSNASQAKAALTLGCDAWAKGRLGYDGALQLVPLRSEGQLEVTALRLDAFAPYVEQFLNIVITGGALSTRGRLSLDAPEGSPLRVAYRADASVGRFASVDRATSQDLLNWKALGIAGIDFELAPLKLTIGQVTLAELYSRLIINSDGTLNWQSLAKQKPADPTATSPGVDATSPPPDIHLGKVVLRDGRINFTDYFVKPNYTVMLSGVNGSMSEMTRDKASEVSLTGHVQDTAPVEIAGKLNVLSPDLVVDLKATAQDIELSQMSTYSVKYAGYGIDKGKLSLKLTYLVQDRKLVAENNLYVDQLTFGEKVDSPTATKLPVLFAVALLKDRNGVIDVNLPVSGPLDDPQFSVGSVIMRVFVNLIEKAVTSPFALIGSVFGGGEELAFVEFSSGSATVAPAQEEKLKTLAKALYERPALKLDVSGRIDPDADRDALKHAAVERQLKAAKARETELKTAETAALQDVTIEPVEHDKYLAAAYRAADFERPRNATGALQELPASEMERLMLAHAEVSDDELRALAQARAQAAKDWLVETGQVPVARVFIVAPKMSAAGIGDKGKSTRVDFALK
jgi:uncharacterized protein involved in outer membrane biogenesis